MGNFIAKLVCIIVGTGALWTGMLFSAALSKAEQTAAINAKAEVYLEMPIDELGLQNI